MTSDRSVREPRGPLALMLLALLGLALFVSFIALGNWQVRRLAWKEALIKHARERVHVAPVPAPGPAQWAGVNATNAAYRHVRLRGTWLSARQIRVWTTTLKGSGYWILTPLQRIDGTVVLVNRGFAPNTWCDRQGHCPAAPSGLVTVTGLLRISEPSTWLRHNQPKTDTWYNRDVPEMARSRGLTNVAPYFVDADAKTADSVGTHWPQGGMTVVHFRNHHLQYLITWYVLALMVFGVSIYVAYDEYHCRHQKKK